MKTGNPSISMTIGLVVAAGLLSACSGGASTEAVLAKPPLVLGLNSVELNQDTTSAPTAFRVTDEDTPATSLELSVSSSDPNLLPVSGIVIAGTGTERTISVTPASESVGTANVTVIARDTGGLSNSAVLTVRVNPVLVSFRGITNDSFAMAETGTVARVSGVTVQPDADDDPTAFDALLR